MAEKAVGVPTMSGVGSSFKNFGLGAVGGIVFLLAYQLFGALGVIAAPLIAGSMLKGSRGDIIATMAGFMLIAIGAFSGSSGGSGSSGSGEYM